MTVVLLDHQERRVTAPSYSRGALFRQASLTQADEAEIAKCRGEHNRLGFAYQIGFTRLFNRFPNQQPLEIDAELLNYVAVQLNLDAEAIKEYAPWQHTVSEHQARIRQYLGFRPYDAGQQARLEQFIFEESCRLEQTASLLARTREFLQEQRILSPADYALLRLVGEQKKLARERIVSRIADTMSSEMAHTIDNLLEIAPGDTISPLQRIKANAGSPSAGSMQALMDKLLAIEATGILAVDLSWLNANYQRAMFHYVRKCTADRMRELARPRRLAALTCFLRQSYRDAVDQAVDMFDKIATHIQTDAENELDEKMRRQKRTIKAALFSYRSLGRVILNDDISDAELRETLFLAVPREQMADQVAGLEEWVSGKSSDVFHGVVRRFSYFRQFTPLMLRVLEFFPDGGQTNSSCLEAVQLLKEMNAEQKGKKKLSLPDDAPMEFVPKRLLPIVTAGGAPSRHAWECALMLKLQDEVKSGNVSLKHSKRFGRFDDYFLPQEQWEARRQSFFERARLPSDPKDVPAFVTARLNTAYDLFLKSAPSNTFAMIDEDGWHLAKDVTEKLTKEESEALDRLKAWLRRHMRTIRLPDLLIEVDNDIHFTDHFLPPGQRGQRNKREICEILAAILAHGCNIGLGTMAELVEGISYKQLKRVSDWQLTEEAQRAALAALVHAISRLDATVYWGEGRTSASDGQRFSMRRKVLQQTYSTRFSDFALEFYSFVADNYAPFYSAPIECTDRDAPFVLDGLLYNESDLPLEEHYVDTHGFIELNFAAFAMLGRSRFCPRIKGVQHQRIYRIDPDRDYGILSSLVARTDRTIDPDEFVEHWDRMGQFYASLECGHTTASVAIQRLVACSAKNQFYSANRDLGRIFKTEFILRYLSEPQLRARIRRGLLKVEQLHALARDIYYARRGRVNARELHEQMNSCSCLTLLLACVIYWQAKEISRIVQMGAPERENVDFRLLEHVSPIEWENVILYGLYPLNPDRIR